MLLTYSSTRSSWAGLTRASIIFENPCEERWTRGSSTRVTAVDGRAPGQIDRDCCPATHLFRLSRHVGLAEPVAAIGERELAVRRHGRVDPVALALGGLLEVRDHVGRRIVARIFVQQRQVALPDAFQSPQVRPSQAPISLVTS